MANKIQHTPTPWRVHINEFHEMMIAGQNAENPNYRENVTAPWKERRHGAKRGQPVVFWGFDPKDEANAAFIIHAVNAHQELVEACKNALDVFASEAKYNGEINAVRQLERAIAKAEGKYNENLKS